MSWTWKSAGFCLGALLGATALIAPPTLSKEPEPIPVIDLHVDLAYRSYYKKKPFGFGSGQFRATHHERGGLRGVVLPLYVPEWARPHGRSRYQFEKIYAHVFSNLIKTSPYSLPGCRVNRAGSDKRMVSTWLAFEGAGPVGGDEKEVRKWALRGVRSFGLVHSVHNELATSSGKEHRHEEGLSDEGRAFVNAVAQVRGLVDISHSSDAAADEAIALSRKLSRPIIATHSNARALAPHPRNLTDEQIRGIAASGGVVGVNFHQPFLAKRPGARANIKDVVQQISHMKAIGGIDVVALGSDFEGGIFAVPELSDAGKYQRLASELMRAGFTKSEVRKVFFKNAERVLCAAEKRR